RTPTNGGATPQALRPKAAGARPGLAQGGRPPLRPAPKPRPKPVVERVRRTASADLEAEMLQRFDQLRDQDLYQVLGVAPTATTTDIRHEYYGLAKTFH